MIKLLALAVLELDYRLEKLIADDNRYYFIDIYLLGMFPAKFKGLIYDYMLYISHP
jgi:hypothetical protein